MLERIKYGWRNFRILASYTPDQLKRLERVCDLYKQYINPNIEEESFLTIDQEGKPTKKVNQEHLIYPNKIVHNSPLAPFVNAILSELAQYIEWRLNRNDAYSNDPQILFCMEIIRWVKQSLLKTDVKLEESRTEVNKWRKFLNNVSNQDVFPTEEANDRKHSLFASIKNIENLLAACEQRINFELNRITLGDVFEQLSDGCQNLIIFLFDFLVNVLSDQEVPTNLTMLSLYNHVLSDEIQDLLTKYKTGEFAVSIAYDPAVRDVFFIDECSNLPHATDVISFNKHTRLSQVPMISDFIGANGAVNADIEKQLASDEGKKLGLINFLKHIDKDVKKQLSITVDAETQAGFYNAYIRLHGLTKMLAHFTLIFREAGYLAKSGGEILLCKLAYQNIVSLMTYFKDLLRIIDQENTRSLKGRLDKIHATLKVSKVSNNVKTWVGNYQLADTALSAFNETLASARHLCGKVDGILTNLDARMLDVKIRLQSFIHSTDMLAQSCQWFPEATNAVGAAAQTAAPLPNKAFPALESKKPDIFSFKPKQKEKVTASGASNEKPAKQSKPKARTLDLSAATSEFQVDQVALLLTKVKDLETLNFSKHPMLSKTANKVIRAIAKNTELSTLIFADNGLEIRGINKLATTVDQHPTLQALDISRNYLGTQGTAAFVAAWQTNDRLQFLNLSHNTLTPEGFNAIVKSFPRSLQLAELHLSHNLLGTVSNNPLLLNQLITLMAKSIKVLDLSHNAIRFDNNNQGKQFATALTTNCIYLQALYLQGNKLDDETCQALHDGLSRSQRKIILGLNQSDCADKWWESFKHLPNVTITSDMEISEADKQFLTKVTSGAPGALIGLLNETTARWISKPIPSQFFYENGNTPLHIAVDRLDLNLLQVLCKYQKDLNLRNFYGDNLLHTALLSRVWTDEANAVLDYLIARGVDINTMNHQGQTPLILAVQRLNFEVVKKLLRNNAILDITDREENTAEKIAAKSAKELKGSEQQKAQQIVDYIKQHKQNLTQAASAAAGAMSSHGVFRSLELVSVPANPSTASAANSGAAPKSGK